MMMRAPFASFSFFDSSRDEAVLIDRVRKGCRCCSRMLAYSSSCSSLRLRTQQLPLRPSANRQYRQYRDRVLIFELANQVNDLLRAADSECWNQNRSFAFGSIVDDSRQRYLRIFRIVQTIAIS